MPASSNLEKRIKRHVIGRPHTFFVATSPHLASTCHEEMVSALPHLQDFRPVSGGFEFSGKLADGYLANLKLRTANRILMRIDQFKATNFRQLGKKMSEIPWELYIKPGTGIRVTVAVHKSRLYHKTAVNEYALKGISQRLPNIQPSSTGQLIQLRGKEDRFTVSLDTSGDLLYRRGIKPLGHKAPMRETLAAAALLMAGFTPGMPLVDPMSGAGTFSIEAALITRNMPPGMFRSFAFMNWPGFRPRQWAYLIKSAQSQQQAAAGPSIFAADINAPSCERLRLVVKDFGLEDTISVRNRDFFSYPAAELSPSSGLVAINPPYGIRIRPDNRAVSFFKQTVHHLKQHYGGWKYLLVVPHEQWLNRSGLKYDLQPVSHGGLTVFLAFGRLQ